MRMTFVAPPAASIPAPRNGQHWTPSVFESADTPADADLLERLEQSVHGMDLAAPPVVLPDFHHKHNIEMPSSIAIATRETIRPTLTSAAVNCGMALMAFDSDQPSERTVSEFFDIVRRRLPYPSGNQRDLTADEVARCAYDGARFAADRYDVNRADLDRIEEGGRLDPEIYGGVSRARRQLPWLLTQLSRCRFGIVGPSNHFIELQRVEEIYEPDTARLLGIAEGQLTLQYHGGGGILTGAIGRLFGRRIDYPRKHRVVMAWQKPLYHLATAGSLDEARTRLALYFRDGCPPVPRHGSEGQRLLLANALAMNYGFAFRLATYAALRGAAREVLGINSDRLIVELAAQLDVRGGASRRERRDAPPQLIARLPRIEDDGAPGVLDHGSTGAAARHQPHLVLSLRRRRGRGRGPAHHVPRHRDDRRRLRAARPLTHGSPGPIDTPLRLRHDRSRARAAPR